MRPCLRRTLWGSLFAGGIIVLGAAAANAAEQPPTDGANNLASATSAAPATPAPASGLKINIPINLSGNAISVIGNSKANGPTAPSAPANDGSINLPINLSGHAISLLGTGTQAKPGTPPAANATPQVGTTVLGTSTLGGLLPGLEQIVSINIPITLSGNALSVIGDSDATSAAPAAGPAPSSPTTGSKVDGDTIGQATSGGLGVFNGWQAVANANAPVTVSGNAVSLIGNSKSSGSQVGATGAPGTGGGALTGGDTVGQVTSGGVGAFNGNQAHAGAKAPITVSGNAVSLIGDSESTDSKVSGGAGSSLVAGSKVGQATSGGIGAFNGNTANADAAAPITVSGNAISAIGNSKTKNSQVGGGPANGNGSLTGGDTVGQATAGGVGAYNGNVANANAKAPVTVSGNGVSLLGNSSSENSKVGVPNPAATGNGALAGGDVVHQATGGGIGAFNGNQAQANADAPITVSGNAIGLTGNAASKNSTVGGAQTTPGTGNGSLAGGNSNDMVTAGGIGRFVGNQADANAKAPLTISGNAIGACDAESNDSTVGGGNPGIGALTGGDRVGQATAGGIGEYNGNQSVANAKAPITISGNAISGLSTARSNHSVVGGNGIGNGTVGNGSLAGGNSTGQATQGGIGEYNGNTADANAKAPVTVSGNAISVLNQAQTDNSLVGGSNNSSSNGALAGGDSVGQATAGGIGAYNGNTATANAKAPIVVSGNSISGFGKAHSADSVVGGAGANAAGNNGSLTGGDTVKQATAGGVGAWNGNQAVADAKAPLVISGNSISGLNDSESKGSVVGGANGGNTGSLVGSDSTSQASGGGVGAFNGNQAVANAKAPIIISGNAISAVRAAQSTNSVVGTSAVNGSLAGGDTTGQTTAGGVGAWNGNQAVANAKAPIVVANNAVSGLGEATSKDSSVGANTGLATSNNVQQASTGGVGAFAGNNAAASVKVVPVWCDNPLNPIAGSIAGACKVGSAQNPATPVLPGVPGFGGDPLQIATPDPIGSILPIKGGSLDSVIRSMLPEIPAVPAINGSGPVPSTDGTPVVPGAPVVPADPRAIDLGKVVNGLLLGTPGVVGQITRPILPSIPPVPAVPTAPTGTAPSVPTVPAAPGLGVVGQLLGGLLGQRPVPALPVGGSPVGVGLPTLPGVPVLLPVGPVGPLVSNIGQTLPGLDDVANLIPSLGNVGGLGNLGGTIKGLIPTLPSVCSLTCNGGLGDLGKVIGGLLPNIPGTPGTPGTGLPGLPDLGGLIKNLPIVGGLLGGGTPGTGLPGLPDLGGLIKNLPIVGGLLGGGTGTPGLPGLPGLPDLGGLIKNLPIVGGLLGGGTTVPGLPGLGGLLGGLPIIGGLFGTGTPGTTLPGLPGLGGFLTGLPIIGGLFGAGTPGTTVPGLPGLGGLLGGLPIIGGLFGSGTPGTTVPGLAGLGGLLGGLLGGVLPGKPAGPLDPGKTVGGLPVVGDLLKTIGSLPVVGNIAQGLPLVGEAFKGGTGVPGLPGTPALPVLGDLGKAIKGLPVLGSLPAALSSLPLVGTVLDSLLGLGSQNPGTDPGTNPGTDPGKQPGQQPGQNPGGNPGTNPGQLPGNGNGNNPIPGVGVGTTGNTRPNGWATGVNGSGEPLVLVSSVATRYNTFGGISQYGSQAKVNPLASTGVADAPLAGVGIGVLALGMLLLALSGARKPKNAVRVQA